MTNNRKLKIFLCHSQEDKPEIRELYQRLISDEFDVWLDEEKLVPGQEWDLEIKKAIRDADAVIVCLSQNSITKSGYVQKELRMALDIADEKPEGEIYLIPAKLEDCPVPLKLSRWHWVNLFAKNGYKKLLSALQRCEDNLNLRITFEEAQEEKHIRRVHLIPNYSNMLEVVSIPILGPISTGIPLPEIKSNISETNKTDFLEIATFLLPSKKSVDLFSLEVIGDSLSDAMINDGDIVVLKQTTKARNGEMVAMWLPESNEAILRYFYKEKSGYRLQPANPVLEPMFIPEGIPIEIKGKVVMVVRLVEKK